MKCDDESLLTKLSERESVLWVCLILQILLYWTLAFLSSTGNEFVAYQRY